MKCINCCGTGLEPDHRKNGLALRAKRLKKDIPLKDVAAELGITPSYLCDLENGRRNWNAQLLRDYMDILILKGKA